MATSFSNPYGSGDRIATVYVSASPGLIEGDPRAFVNGTIIGPGSGPTKDFFLARFYKGVSAAWLKFEFLSPQVIDGWRFGQAEPFPQGFWRWFGSNDDATYEPIGNTFELVGGSDIGSVKPGLDGNTLAYKFYRLSLISGTTYNGVNESPYIFEIDFRIEAGVAEPSSDSESESASASEVYVPTFGSLYGFGNRLSSLEEGTDHYNRRLIEASTTLPVAFEASRLIDGLYHTVPFLHFGSNAPGPEIRFDFFSPLVMRGVRVHKATGDNSYWRLEGLVNPDDWKASAGDDPSDSEENEWVYVADVAMTGSGISETIFFNDYKFESYRFVLVSGTVGSFYQFDFDFAFAWNYEAGDRRGFISVTSNMPAHPDNDSSVDISDLIDGRDTQFEDDETTTRETYGFGDVLNMNGYYIDFDFGGQSNVIRGLFYVGRLGVAEYDCQRWDAGSSSWVTMHRFADVISPSPRNFVIWDNDTASTKFRLAGVAGSSFTDNYGFPIQIKLIGPEPDAPALEDESESFDFDFDFVSNYNGWGGRGYRGLYVAASTTFSLITDGPVANLVNGSFANNYANSCYFDNSGVAVAGKYFQFDFKKPVAVSGLKWYQASASSIGVYKLQWSLDGVTFNDVSGTFELGVATTTEVNILNLQTARYWRVTGVSGTTAFVWLNEIEFKTIHHPLEHGDRTLLIDATGTEGADYPNLVTGVVVDPATDTNVYSFGLVFGGQSITYDFLGKYVELTGFAWNVNVGTNAYYWIPEYLDETGWHFIGSAIQIDDTSPGKIVNFGSSYDAKGFRLRLDPAAHGGGINDGNATKHGPISFNIAGFGEYETESFDSESYDSETDTDNYPDSESESESESFDETESSEGSEDSESDSGSEPPSESETDSEGESESGSASEPTVYVAPQVVVIRGFD